VHERGDGALLGRGGGELGVGDQVAEPGLAGPRVALRVIPAPVSPTMRAAAAPSSPR
jgi:hypothetical protein